ncbi:hypothetical protein [Shouchella shacheensis]|uniref:hypothetical protein n=1 Tax=Shouchella shacheensis TaxID=1649580 RepID=UPI000740017C|nr:hypothetical protein [Shouchella shacheensis]
MAKVQYKAFFNSAKKFDYLAYGYGSASYKKVVEEAKLRDFKQVIITTAIFKSIVKLVYEKGLFVAEINFIDPLEDYLTEDMRELLDQINQSKGNKLLINTLFKSIDWLVNDESIDIKEIVVFKKGGTSVKTTIYNNGVFFTTDQEIDFIKNELLTPVLRKHI